MARAARTQRAVIVPARFNGPPTSANGGWVAGVLAQHLDPGAAVTVTLRQPPPLDVTMDVETTVSGLELRHGDVVLAVATVAEALAEALPAVEPDVAAGASRRFLDFPGHPFTECFVCGTARPHDGLHVYPGPVDEGDWTRTAATFVPPAELAGRPELMWAALDCPGGWAGGIAESPALLASYTVQLHEAPAAGEPCVLVGHDDGARGRSGRARATRSAGYGADGQLLGRAEAIWIRIG